MKSADLMQQTREKIAAGEYWEAFDDIFDVFESGCETDCIIKSQQLSTSRGAHLERSDRNEKRSWAEKRK